MAYKPVQSEKGRPLSIEPTPFLGRQRELSEVVDRLTGPDCRLVSVVGPGGIGKTRLALEVAASLDQTDDFPEGVHFVPLQSVTKGDLVASAIAETMDIGLSGAESPAAQILHYLSDKQLLLVLDNTEQLVDQGELDLISRIIRAAPNVKMLVTSRRALQLRSEWRYPLQGLPVPNASELDEAEKFDAVRFFAACATRVQPDFNIRDELAEVVRICRLVEGMPLAIELAAGWRRSLTSQSIAAEIEQGLDILQTDLRDMPDRHRNLQAVFDHTWQALSEADQSVFKRLSIFRGGFRRQAAEKVAGATFAGLSRLVDQSLLRYGPLGRYDLHELLRQYGEEKLRRSPSAASELRRRHAEYYTRFLQRRLDRVHGPEQRQAFAEIDAELQNVRAAWRWAVSEADQEAIERAATTYFLYCQQKCTYLEGANALARAAASLTGHPSTDQRDRVLALLRNHEGWLRIRVGNFQQAKSLLERSCSLYQSLEIPPPPHMGGASEAPLALVAVIQGELDRALSLGESARQSSHERQDQHNLAFAHYALATTRLALGDYEEAEHHAARSAALARSLGNRWFLGYPLNEWGKAALAKGDRAEAEHHFQASFAIKSEFNDAEGMGVALNHLGEIARLQQNFSTSQEAFNRSLNIYRTLNDRGGLATSYRGLAKVALDMGAAEQARQCFHKSLEISTEIRYLPLIFSLLVEVAPLLRQQDRSELAASLLSLVQRHPASDHEAKSKAQQQLEELEEQMAPQVIAAALRQSESWDLASAIDKLQALLATTEVPAEPPASPEGDLIEPLTARELEVLELIAEGHSNAQIAEQLVLAVGTVKWYASQIYGKLAVNNRTEAAARARELNLL